MACANPLGFPKNKYYRCNLIPSFPEAELFSDSAGLDKRESVNSRRCVSFFINSVWGDSPNRLNLDIECAIMVSALEANKLWPPMLDFSR